MNGKRILASLAAAALLPGAAAAPASAGPSKWKTKKELHSVKEQIESVEKKREEVARRKEEAERRLRRERRRLSSVERLESRYRKDATWSKFQQERFARRAGALDRSHDIWARSLEDEMARYASGLVGGGARYSNAEVWNHLMLRRVIREKADYLRAVHDAREVTHESREKWAQKAGRFEDLKEKVGARKTDVARKVETEKERYSTVSVEYKKLSGELEALRASQKQLGEMLAKLTAPQRSTSAGQALSQAPDRDVRPGSMTWPVPGKVLSSFGKTKVAELGTWYVNEGLRLSAGRGDAVKAAASGRVIFAGPFRSYGNVVILDHGGDLFSIYGGLSRIEAEVGRDFSAGQVLGRAGKSRRTLARATAGSDLYFEVRKGNKAVDPMRWLRKR